MTKRTKRISVALGGAVVAAALACAAALPSCSGDNLTTSTAAAEEGLALMRSMAEGDEFAFFGYASAADVGSEELGDPFEVKTLDADALVAGEAPSDAMIVALDEYLFPVNVRGTPIGAIRVALGEDGDWEYLATESKAEVVGALAAIAAGNLDRDGCYLLDLEEIELFFLGYESGGRTMLVPLVDDTTGTFVRGRAYAFTDIAPEIAAEFVAARETYESMVPPEAAAVRAPAAAAVRPPAKAAVIGEKLLSLANIAQEQDQWCWAATGRMTMLHAGGDAAALTQCAQANSVYAQTTCCEDGSASACNKPNWPRYETWGFTATSDFDSAGTALSWEDLKAAIDGDKPVAFLWKWKKGGGHYMVAVGYYEDARRSPATRMVYVNNPWPPNEGEQQTITYGKWVGGTRYNNLQTGYYSNIAKR